MEMHAYSFDYLRWAQRILGDAVDFAVNTYGFTLDEFEKIFLNSRAVLQFQKGNCKYVAGITGCELFRLIAEENRVDLADKEDIMYTDKSPEYWTGWALAFYQWYRAIPFAQILKNVHLQEISHCYAKYHEMDVMQFADHLDERTKTEHEVSRLKRIREYCHLSQSQLAERSGVAIRQIQLFEQGKRDINKTQAETLFLLSKTLHCEMKDLLEMADEREQYGDTINNLRYSSTGKPKSGIK